jgi:hypothetical protein
MIFMDNAPPFKYRSSGFSEPGIYVELYLPKKVKYQETLYKTLTEGFDLKKVKKHFLDPVKKPLIQSILAYHPQWSNYSDEYIEQMEQFYWGYSLYEVDGVFNSSRQPGIPIEERTQVVRIMFLPDVKAIISSLKLRDMPSQDVVDIVADVLRATGHRRGEYGASITDKSIITRITEANDTRSLKYIINDEIRPIIEYVEKWFDYVGLFLFGYVIFEICSKIRVLEDSSEIQSPEEEIWLTSFWNLNVNRVTYIKLAI